MRRALPPLPLASLPPLLHNPINKPKLQRLLRRHKMIPLQRSLYTTISHHSLQTEAEEPTESVLCLDSLFSSDRTMLRIHIRQQLPNPQDLFRVDRDIRCLSRCTARRLCTRRPTERIVSKDKRGGGRTMNHDACVRETVPMSRSARGEEE
jgi:hypothetical protein